MIRGLRFVIASALVFAACKRNNALDAGVVEARVVEEENIGVTLRLPPVWSVAAGTDAGLSPGWLADARRPADAARPSLVTPRIVATSEPMVGWQEIDTLLERTLGGIRKIEDSGRARILKTSKGRRSIGGMDMGELRVDYRVSDPAKTADRDVVQRVWLVQRFGADDKPYVFSLTLTHLAADEELVARDLESVLMSVQFR